jgi:hypothetical protein
MKEGSPGHAGVGERSLVVRSLLPTAQVATSVGMGVAVALAAVWAQYMVTVLLVPGGTSPLPEVVWWAVLLGVVACVLATVVGCGCGRAAWRDCEGRGTPTETTGACVAECPLLQSRSPSWVSRRSTPNADSSRP